MNEKTKQKTKKWLQLSLFCPLPMLEALTDLLAVLSGSGVEQSPEDAEGAILSAFFPLDGGKPREEILAQTQEEVNALFALYELPPAPLESRLLADEDWATSWQQYFRPFAIVPQLVIRPSWEDVPATEGVRILEMDPGMAFGTGQHATTRMAVALIQRCLAKRRVKRVLDVGTGTGILAMAAALFGADTALGLDNDPEALKVARRNARVNGLEQRIELAATPVEELRQGEFDLICANIVHDVLAAMAPHLARLLAPQGRVILSGILGGAQEESILRLYQNLGLELVESLHQEEWCALLLAFCKE